MPVRCADHRGAGHEVSMISTRAVWWRALLLLAAVRGAMSAEYNLAGRPGEGYVLQVQLGRPHQALNVLIDTGSTNFAVAGAPHGNIDTYFVCENSTSLRDLDREVSVLYTQGSWAGHLASDYVFFPTLNSVPEVRCDIAFITETNNFYMNGSNWQGILGVAYPAISRPDSHVLSWIDSLQQSNKDKTMAFSLTLCGSYSPYNTDHYGSFEILNNVAHSYEGLLETPVIKDWFYEVVMTGISVGGVPIDVDCKDLNGDKTIVDSGTTDLRLPQTVFRKLVSVVSEAAHDSVRVLDSFWRRREVACWPEPRRWDHLPKLAIQLAYSAQEYFVIELPGPSYVRQVYTETPAVGEVPQYCYKFGIESSTTGSILGVVAMEGFQVIFNRTGHKVGFRRSNCGPNVTVAGPFARTNVRNLLEECSKHVQDQLTMLEMAAYIVCALLIVATVMFLYLLVQWLKEKYFKCHVAGTAVSLSHTSLINEDQ